MLKKLLFNQHYIEKLFLFFKLFLILIMIAIYLIKNDFNNNNNAQNYNNNYKIIKPEKQFINLNKKIINRYMHLFQNFYERPEIKNLFPHTKIIDDKIIKIIVRRLIYKLIKNKLFTASLLLKLANDFT